MDSGVWSLDFELWIIMDFFVGLWTWFLDVGIWTLDFGLWIIMDFLFRTLDLVLIHRISGLRVEDWFWILSQDCGSSFFRDFKGLRMVLQSFLLSVTSPSSSP